MKSYSTIIIIMIIYNYTHFNNGISFDTVMTLGGLLVQLLFGFRLVSNLVWVGC